MVLCLFVGSGRAIVRAEALDCLKSFTTLPFHQVRVCVLDVACNVYKVMAALAVKPTSTRCGPRVGARAG